MIKNPPIGSYPKKLKDSWTKYYEKSLDFYQDKKRAAATAWMIVKKKWKKSKDTGKWILKDTKKKVKKITKKTVRRTKKIRDSLK